MVGVGDTMLAKGYNIVVNQGGDTGTKPMSHLTPVREQRDIGLRFFVGGGFVLRQSLAMELRLTLNSRSSCLSHLSVRIAGMGHHPHLECHS